jgi:5-methylcytosine-specific restriction endonuclease McrA
MSDELPKTRAEARETGSKRYFTGEPCKHGHISPRDTKEGKCVQCVNERNMARVNADRDAHNAKRRAYRASNADAAEACRQRAKEYYHANAKERMAYIQRWRKLNPEKHKQYGRDYHRRYPDKTKAYTKAWRSANPEQRRAQVAVRRTRLLSAEGTYNKGDIQSLMQKQHGNCAICLKKLPSNYHVDHITPLARGGSNWPTNLQLTCPSCNTQKNAKDPYDFMRSRGLLL